MKICDKYAAYVGTKIISNYGIGKDPIWLVFRKGFTEEVKFELSTFSVVIRERGRTFQQKRSMLAKEGNCDTYSEDSQ